MIRAHKFEHELAQEETVTKEQVTEVMMQNWQATREAEISLTRRYHAVISRESWQCSG